MAVVERPWATASIEFAWVAGSMASHLLDNHTSLSNSSVAQRGNSADLLDTVLAVAVEMHARWSRTSCQVIFTIIVLSRTDLQAAV
jgi:hypothetical protein